MSPPEMLSARWRFQALHLGAHTAQDLMAGDMRAMLLAGRHAPHNQTTTFWGVYLWEGSLDPCLHTPADVSTEQSPPAQLPEHWHTPSAVQTPWPVQLFRQMPTLVTLKS